MEAFYLLALGFEFDEVLLLGFNVAGEVGNASGAHVEFGGESEGLRESFGGDILLEIHARNRK